MRAVQRVRDDRAGLHEHRAAAAIRRTTSKPCFAAFSGSTSFFNDWKLPMTTRRLVPLPDPQGRLAPPRADLLGEHLVERQVQAGGDGPAVDDLPVEVASSSVALDSARRTAIADRLGR